MMHSIRRNLAFGGVMAVAAAALAGCAGDPEDPDSSLAPRDDSTASATATSETETSASPDDELPGERPELWSIVEEYEGEYVMAGAAGSIATGVQTFRQDVQVSLESNELEIHIYCTPIGTSGVLSVNSQRHTIECPGTETPEILMVSTDGAESSSDIEWNLRLDDSVSDWQQAVVLLPAE